jgi:arylsulfatase A
LGIDQKLNKHNYQMRLNLLFTGISSLLVSSQASAVEKKQKPNIVFILADDLGYGDLGCYGQKIIKTPNIDKLASDGMLFTQHYAGCTVSAPSRSALLTGLHTGHTPIRGNKEVGDEGQHPLPENTFTMAEMLKQAGYVTGAFGKWGLGYPGSEGDPNKQGFDEFYGYNCQRLAHYYYPTHLWHNQTKINLPGNTNGIVGIYAQDMIHKEAMKFIRENKSKPFFAFLPYILPHADIVSPDDSIRKMYAGIKPGIPFIGIDKPNGHKPGGYNSSDEPHIDFAAMIARLDAYVGEVVAELKKQGIDKNTIVIFTSDNGPHEEGGANPAFFNSYGPLRGVKRDMYEGGIRVPMIVSWPGKTQQGVKTEQVSAFWDFMPTFKELARVKTNFASNGISIVPTLLSNKKQKQHEYLYWEFHEMGGRIAIRKGNWKGIKLNYGKNPDNKMLLFDLSTDIHEDNNVAEKHPEIVTELEKLIKSSRTESAVFNFGRSK